MSFTDRIEEWCGNVVLKNLKRPFIVALFTLLIVLFIIFSTISVDNSLCNQLHNIEYYLDENLINGTIVMPINLTIAFISDTRSSQSKDVYRLIKNEGAELLIHSGEFGSYPSYFDAEITEILGKHFPLLGVMGDLDYGDWADPPGYQDYLLLRLRMTYNITCSGTIGVNYWCVYRGLFFAFSGIGQHTNCKNILKSLQSSLSSTTASQFPFKICSWHKNQRLMQVTNKQDETGYDPYEICREEGAMIVTGQSHYYSRSHLLSSTINRQIESDKSPYSLKPGTTLVVVNGMGGENLDNSLQSLEEMPHWGATYGTNFGALFCIYNLNGDASRALCYFKDINGIIADRFEIVVSGN